MCGCSTLRWSRRTRCSIVESGVVGVAAETRWCFGCGGVKVVTHTPARCLFARKHTVGASELGVRRMKGETERRDLLCAVDQVCVCLSFGTPLRHRRISASVIPAASSSSLSSGAAVVDAWQDHEQECRWER